MSYTLPKLMVVGAAAALIPFCCPAAEAVHAAPGQMPTANQTAVLAEAADQYRLGVEYLTGRGAAQNFAAAAEAFRKAAEQGHVKAAFNLGLLYGKGQGVPQDMSEAAKWWRQAAVAGNAEAQYRLGQLYALGSGTPQDYDEALKLFKAAADQGQAQAQSSLGALYGFGHGVTRDYSKAEYWYRKAAEQGDVVGQFNLGDLYAHGRGVAVNLVEADLWWELASSETDPEAPKIRELAQSARETLTRTMSAEQVAEGSRRALEWRKAHPGWSGRTGADGKYDSDLMLSYYPHRARDLNLPGKAVINCAVTEAGGLQDCRVVSEEPTDFGFGEAALQLAKTFHMKPKISAGEAAAGPRVTIPIAFHLAGPVPSPVRLSEPPAVTPLPGR
jgi:TonB family protein